MGPTEYAPDNLTSTRVEDVPGPLPDAPRCAESAGSERGDDRPGASPSAATNSPRTPAPRFTSLEGGLECLARIEIYSEPAPPSACVLYVGACNAEGYGYLVVDGKTERVTRLLWAILHGPIPAGLMVMHSCDVPSCVNPAHLGLGTNSDNQKDSVGKGRHAKQRVTACPRGHTRFRLRNEAGRSRYRACLECDRERKAVRRREGVVAECPSCADLREKANRLAEHNLVLLDRVRAFEERDRLGAEMLLGLAGLQKAAGA